MAKLSQKKRVLKRLKELGRVTRNECLNTNPRITRLGAIICDLKKEGYVIEGKEEGNDYVYTANIPKPPKPEIIERDGKRIAVFKIN